MKHQCSTYDRLSTSWLLFALVLTLFITPLLVQAQETPLPSGTMTVESTIEFDLTAGAARQSAYLAPAGDRFIHFDGEAFCLYTLEGEQQYCSEAFRGVDSESVRWSPDGRYLVMTENFFVFFRDPDLWLLDTTSGELTNITDDGLDDVSLFGAANEQSGIIDLLPRWLDAETVAFLRYERWAPETTSPQLMSLSVDTGSLETIAELNAMRTRLINAFDIFPDERIAIHNGQSAGQRTNLIWLTQFEDGSSSQIVQVELFVMEFFFSPDGRYALLGTGPGFAPAGPPAQNSLWRLFSLESGDVQLIDEARYITSAGWLPDGSGLLYTVRNSEQPEQSGLYITRTVGGQGHLILPGNYAAPTPQQRHPLTLGAQNTLLLMNTDNFQLMLVQLAAE